MQLIASLMGDNLFDEPLAEVRVASDTAEGFVQEPRRQHIRRTIEGTVSRRGEIWDHFFTTWERGIRLDKGGKSFYTVNALQIDRDLYPFGSCVYLDGDTIRILVVESFNGKLEDYREAVRERNRRVDEYLSRWEQGQITRNDLRELTDLPRKAEPFFNEVLTPDAIAEVRKSHAGKLLARRVNTIV